VKLSVKAAIALLVLALIGTGIGIAARLPYQFGGQGEPERIMEDFVSKGTAVSPPLVALLALIGGALLASRAGALGRIGSGVLALLSIVFFIATIGELIGSGAFSGLAQVVVVIWSVLGAAVIALMFLSGIREVLRRP
jgi:hypothetical protein